MNVRMVVYDLTNPSAPPKQFIYQLDSCDRQWQEFSPSIAINSSSMSATVRRVRRVSSAALHMVDLNQPAAPTDLTGTAFAGTDASNGLPASGTPSGVVPLIKTLFADIGSILRNATPTPFSNVNGSAVLPDKIEGYAWGPNLPDGRHLLLATNDNDFVQPSVSLDFYPAAQRLPFTFEDGVTGVALRRMLPMACECLDRLWHHATRCPGRRQAIACIRAEEAVTVKSVGAAGRLR